MRKTLIAMLFAIMAALCLFAPLSASASPRSVIGHAFPAGDKVYYIPTSPSDTADYVVVATSGINISPTASFTISAGAEAGFEWDPYGPLSAFSAYLEQIGTFFYGPGTATPPVTCYPAAPPASTLGLTAVATLDNGETNHVPVTIYEGDTPGSAQAAAVVRGLLTNGSFTGLPASLDPGPSGQCY